MLALVAPDDVLVNIATIVAPDDVLALFRAGQTDLELGADGGVGLIHNREDGRGS